MMRQIQNFPMNSFERLDYLIPLNQFMRTLVLNPRVADFQLGMEVPKEETLVKERMLFGVIYFNGRYQKCFKMYIDVHKFYSNTFKRLKRWVKGKRIEQRFKFMTPPLTQEQWKDYEKILEAISILRNRLNGPKGNRYSLKDKNEVKPDKIEHGIEIA
ncbi:hypothetical protein Tco_1378647 [Tanacetum coccineum]